MIKGLVGSATALAMLVGMSAPAQAGWGHGGYGGYGHGYGGYHHHHGGDTFGNILLGAVIGGGIFAVANSANKQRTQTVVSRSGDDQRDDLRIAGSDAREVSAMCSEAIESMARGRVSSINSVDREADGWRVDGMVDVDHDGDRHFLCGVRDGRIETVQLSDRDLPRRGAR